MVQISRLSISDKARSRPEIKILQAPSNLTALGQGCFTNNSWNRCLLFFLAFFFGIAATCLDIFPDIKGRVGSNVISDQKKEIHRLKGSSPSKANNKAWSETPNDSKESLLLTSESIQDDSHRGKDDSHDATMDDNNDKPTETDKKGDEQKDSEKNEKKQKKDKNNKDETYDPNHNCDYECKTDRLANETPLFAGQALCNKQYRFGMTKDGDFVVHDCESNVQQVFWSSPYNKGDKNDDNHSMPTLYFKLKEDGNFRVISKDSSKKKTILNEHKPIRKVYPREKCLQKPDLGCPYLHLRGTGKVVINWIDDESDEWMDRYIDRIYPQLYPSGK